MIWPSASPSRYSSSVIQRFSWMITRRIQKFTPPKPDAPMRAKVRKISLALGDNLGGNAMGVVGGGNAAVHGEHQQHFADLVGRGAVRERAAHVHREFGRPVDGGHHAEHH